MQILLSIVMTIAQLKYIVSLSRYDSYVKAAEKSNVTQPALTIQVKKLEDELGLILFDRSKKPVVPTDMGEKLLVQAKKILQEVKKMEDMAQSFVSDVSGELIVGVIPTVAPYLIPVFIDQFNEAYPEIKLLIKEGTTEQIIRDLKEGDIDAGIIATPVKHKGLEATPLFYEKFFLYISDQHPLYIEDSIDIENLSVEDLWLLVEGNCFRNQVEYICNQGREHRFGDNFRYESSSIDSLRRIVEHRQGITFLPELATLSIPAEQEEMIKEIKGQKPVREISMVMVPPFIKQRLVKKLSKEILANIPTYMKEKPMGKVIDTGIGI